MLPKRWPSEFRSERTEVKIRGAAAVFFLALVTFGIYYLVWYYKVNRELRDAAGIDVRPGIALLAITLGALLIVPPFVSTWNTFGRIRSAQEAAGVPNPASPGLGFLLYIVAVIFLPFELIYAQDNLNRLWRQVANATAGRDAQRGRRPWCSLTSHEPA